MKKMLPIGLAAVTLMIGAAAAAPKGAPALHPVQKLELLRLEETWNVLDQVAARVWPGWKGYADVPFLFAYENQTRMLVGHPNPPDEFELVEGVTVRGKKVHLDRTNEVAVELAWPTGGGGGPIPFGKGKDRASMVDTVSLSMRCHRGAAPGTSGIRSENQILLNIHELFHVFQHVFYKTDKPLGNLRYNPDTNYAVYSDIEGQALFKAFQAKGGAEALGHVKDFIAARRLKYKSLTDLEQAQEKSEDFMEGTARYSEYASLLEIGKGYKPKLSTKDDPFFTGFKNRDGFFTQRLEELKHAAGNTNDSRGKCYQYGCFQGLLLNRFAKGWQKTIPAENRYLFDILAARAGMSEADVLERAEELAGRYDVEALFAKHNPPIQARDDAFAAYDGQKGRKYLVDFAKTGEFPRPDGAGTKSFMKVYASREEGTLRYIYPEAFKTLTVQQVRIEGKGLPIEGRELWKVGFVDVKGTGHKISAAKVENNVYTDAVVTTDGFTLTVPKMEVLEKDGNVIFFVLSKVRTP